MTDATTKQIDGFFDAIDRFAEAADRTLNGTKRPSEAKSKAKSKGKELSSSSTAITARPARFHIEEVTDATTGAVIYLVTDGSTARCEFSSRITAQQILEKLETST